MKLFQNDSAVMKEDQESQDGLWQCCLQRGKFWSWHGGWHLFDAAAIYFSLQRNLFQERWSSGLPARMEQGTWQKNETNKVTIAADRG